jgi:hypothetical protein
MARPTKYSERTITRLEEALRLGCTYAAACGYANISDDTLANWRRDKSGFSERLARAEGEATVRWLQTIENAAGGDWRAAAWKLERRYPREYGRNVTEVRGKPEEPIQVRTVTAVLPPDLSQLTTDELREYRRLTAKAAPVDRKQRAVEAAEQAYFTAYDGDPEYEPPAALAS